MGAGVEAGRLLGRLLSRQETVVAGPRAVAEEMEKSRWVLENSFSSGINRVSIGLGIGVLGERRSQGVWLSTWE